MSTSLIVAPAHALLPASLFAPSPSAAQRFIEFFTAQIKNDHTRKSYLNAGGTVEAGGISGHVRELRGHSGRVRLTVAARNDERPDAQSRAVFGAH